MSIKKFLASPLKKVEAERLHKLFKQRFPKPRINKWKEFGTSVSFRICDLEKLIIQSKKALKNANVPEEEWGISLYYIINNLEVSRTGYRKDKPSIMFVTSQYKTDGNGKVIFINNELETTPPLNIEVSDESTGKKIEITHDLNFFNFGDRHP